MSPSPESHMHSNVRPMQDELVGVLKDGRVAVRSAVRHRDRNPRLDGMPVNDRVLRDRPGEPPIGAEQPDELLDRRGNQAGVFS